MNIVLREANQITLEDGTIVIFDNGLWPTDENGNPLRKAECEWNGKTVTEKNKG